MIFDILNIIFNTTFIIIIIYLIIRNNQLVNELKPKKPHITVKSSSRSFGTKLKSPGPSSSQGPSLSKSRVKSTSPSKPFRYDYKLCMECVKDNMGKRYDQIKNCPHCGSENYDTGCIPAILQEGKPNNCIHKSKFTKEQAYRACVYVSNENQQCNLIDEDKYLSYMKDECGEDSYYCSYDESDSCSYHLCKLDDYYSYGKSSSICNCEPSPNENLKPGWGRECKTGNKCIEYMPLRKTPEIWNDPALTRFYSGYASYMDVPNLDKPIYALLADSEMI